MGVDVDQQVFDAVIATATEGVDIGLPLGEESIFLEPTTIADMHAETVTDHLYGYVALQFSYVFPQCCEKLLRTMSVRGARMRYVADQDRPVVDPQSANSDSPHMGYGEVAALYPQEVMLMFNLLKRSFPDDVVIGLIHADHTKAFMKVALHWLYTGQFTVMCNKRFFVLSVTPFGF